MRYRYLVSIVVILSVIAIGYGMIYTNMQRIGGYNTGDVLNDEIDLYVGDDYGAMQIGNIQMFQSDIMLGSLNANGTFFIRHLGGNSTIRFAWGGADNKVRLAIPKEGPEYALYNPRSEMIGGDLGQAFNNEMINCTAQGYRFIDCTTDVTGADLGVQDDFELHGDLFGGNGTWNITNDSVTSIESLQGTYGNGTAYVCVYENGTLFVNDSGCI